MDADTALLEYVWLMVTGLLNELMLQRMLECLIFSVMVIPNPTGGVMMFFSIDTPFPFSNYIKVLIIILPKTYVS